MSLEVVAGHASRAGSRDRNEDFCGYVTPSGGQLASKGVLLAVADGVSGSRGGRESAEYAVRGLVSDYYATPETWTVPHALDRVINAVNQWLVNQARSHREDGLQTTLSALVLRGRRCYIAHVGDSRIYLLRGGRLRRLTVDHVWDRPEMQHVLTRAMGLDDRLLLDHADETLEQGDRYAIVSDGVWEPLGDRELERLLSAGKDAQALATALVDAAAARGGRDDATAVVARIEALPESVLDDALGAGRDLAPPPRALRAGETLDGFEVLERLHASRETVLYKVRDRDGSLAVLKTLPPAKACDSERAAALLTEEWLARRLVARYFPQALPLDGRRTALYYATTFHEGATLERHLADGRHFSVVECVELGIQLLRGLSALHRRDVVHCDVKPANAHLGDDGKLRILDFGVARTAVWQHEATAIPGTPSFMAPELLGGSPPDAGSDLYAAGVTLYHLLTRKYPYGEIEPFQHPRFGDPVPPTRYRPDIPAWLDALLRKAVARDKAQRFETAEEFLFALERGERRPVSEPPPTPLIERDPLRFWRSIAGAAIVLNLLLLYLLVVR